MIPPHLIFLVFTLWIKLRRKVSVDSWNHCISCSSNALQILKWLLMLVIQFSKPWSHIRRTCTNRYLPMTTRWVSTSRGWVRSPGKWAMWSIAHTSSGSWQICPFIQFLDQSIIFFYLHSFLTLNGCVVVWVCVLICSLISTLICLIKQRKMF